MDRVLIMFLDIFHSSKLSEICIIMKVSTNNNEDVYYVIMSKGFNKDSEYPHARYDDYQRKINCIIPNIAKLTLTNEGK